MDQLPPGLVWAVVSTVTGGGLWFVIRLVHQYQRSFTDDYVARNVELEAEARIRDSEYFALQRRCSRMEAELRMARATLRRHGIDWEGGWLDDDPERTRE